MILKGFEQGLTTGMILIYLQKAFDTIDHDILLPKLYSIGFSKHSVNWFQSYSISRTFLVNLRNVISPPSCLSIGVPQGSILGPLLFLILDKMTHIYYKESETLNWLPMTERFSQLINSIVLKYINDQCPNYLNEVFQTIYGKFSKIKMPFPQNQCRSNAVVLHCFHHMEEGSESITVEFLRTNTHLIVLKYRLFMTKVTTLDSLH